jgi:hypothetical protein
MTDSAPRTGGYGVSNDPTQFDADGLRTAHDSSFLNDPRFQKAYRFGLQVPTSIGDDLHIEWRVWIALWAAEQALLTEGDFVECGVYTGVISGAVCDWLNFGDLRDRSFWLLDTFDGLPEDQLLDGERSLNIQNYNQEYKRSGVYESVVNKFKIFSNVTVVKGEIPDSLQSVTSERIAYLSIDLNMSRPEIATMEYFWPKLSPGAVVLLDDYNQRLHMHQKGLLNVFAKGKGVSILGLPTGQGILVKPNTNRNGS